MILTVISGDNREYISFEEPINLAKILRESNKPCILSWSEQNMICGGNAFCLKCKLRIFGNISMPSQNEKSLLCEDDLHNNIRFACMTTLLGDAEITLPEITVNEKNTDNIQTSGNFPEFYLKPWGSKYGMAIDIGTTTVVAFLYDLTSGVKLSEAASDNPQKALGADVVSRLNNSMSGEQDLLSKMIKDCIETLSRKLCEKASISDGIDSISITGNTSMMYFLMGYEVNSIAFSPFIQDKFFGEFISASDIGLNIFGRTKNCLVFLSRSISAYVGGDITTAILSSEIYKSDKPCVLIDIGTNGEIVLNYGDNLYACSAAAGPAFEGGDIEMGMNAENGAISRVILTEKKISFDVIGNISPTGICGSGIIDLVAVMLRTGIIDSTGLIRNFGHDYVDYVQGEEGQAIFTIPGSDVYITQHDIRNIQMAKAAIRAAVSSLIRYAGIDENVISNVKIAGGFGKFIDLKSAMEIGLFSKHFTENAVFIGNAAASGACLVLLNDDLRLMSSQIALKTKTVDIMKDESFMGDYINQMMF